MEKLQQWLANDSDNVDYFLGEGVEDRQDRTLNVFRHLDGCYPGELALMYKPGVLNMCIKDRRNELWVEIERRQKFQRVFQQ